jgi:tetratricopeptide (TPR) repeat protein
VRRVSPILWLVLLVAVVFSLAVTLQPRANDWSPRAGANSLLKVVLGDGRRLFADFFFRKADVYFHGGYYPSIFDRAKQPKDAAHMTAPDEHEEHDHAAHAGEKQPAPGEVAHAESGTNHVETAEEKHMREMDFLRQPKDWIERFGRKFIITDHTHLENGAEREILPWLKITAELDPQKIETYTVAAFWLRTKLNKPKEADEFLREGLKANPTSCEILFELGQGYYQGKDFTRARNVWDLALRRWTEQARDGKKPSEFVLEQITANLARAEEEAGNLKRAIELLELTKQVAPIPEFVQQRIDELKARLAARP